jgi:hypothetical protein
MSRADPEAGLGLAVELADEDGWHNRNDSIDSSDSTRGRATANRVPARPLGQECPSHTGSFTGLFLGEVGDGPGVGVGDDGAEGQVVAVWGWGEREDIPARFFEEQLGVAREIHVQDGCSAGGKAAQEQALAVGGLGYVGKLGPGQG